MQPKSFKFYGGIVIKGPGQNGGQHQYANLGPQTLAVLGPGESFAGATMTISQPNGPSTAVSGQYMASTSFGSCEVPEEAALSCAILPTANDDAVVP